MPNSLNIISIKCRGTGAPAIIPVRRLVQSRPSRGKLKMESNMAGTPWRAVHRSSEIANSVSRGSNISAGYTILAPWVMTASKPSTSPKQWKRGGGQQRTSLCVKSKRSPMKRALLMILLDVNSTRVSFWVCYGGKHTDVSSSQLSDFLLIHW
jgi:hypothetical protein